jgi:hypothetical protein
MSVVIITSLLVAALVSIYHFENKAESIVTDTDTQEGSAGDSAEGEANDQVEQA